MTHPNLHNQYPVLHALLQECILSQVQTIEAWFRMRWQEVNAPIMSSVDLRNAGFKLSPVDTNLFPAGFNNLSDDCLPLCVQAIQAVMNHRFPSCTKIVLLPENHTRNTFYQQSLLRLHDLLNQAGFHVRLGNLDKSMQQTQFIEIHDKAYPLEPLIRDGSRVRLADFDPCMVLLNNDLSSGIPEILQNIDQNIQPPTRLGWYFRRKSNHFRHFAKVAEEFSAVIGLDPWQINPAFRVVEDVDFMTKQGLERLAIAVDDTLSEIKSRYSAFSIKERPYVVVKADNGTYGMGIMTVSSGEEVLQLNRKQRTRMSTTKGSQQLEQVLVQEGVYTFETTKNGSVAEPVVYMIGEFVVGGFYRIHKDKKHDENLNAPGMHFEPVAFSDPCNLPREGECDAMFNQFYIYGVIARLAALAAAKEV